MGENCENQPCEHPGESRRREGGAAGIRAEIPLMHGETMVSTWESLEDLMPEQVDIT